MRSLTQGKTLYPDFSQRQNPEFRETIKLYLNKKKQRKIFDKRKHQVQNQTNHFKKLNEQLSRSLDQKQHELKYLKEVRQRYLASIQNKKNRQQEEKKKLQQLKMYNTTMRQKSIENINDALFRLQMKKSRAHDEVLKNLENLKKRYNLKKSAMDEANKSLFLQVRQSRAKCKNRVNKFFQKKSNQLTRYYKLMINNQQEAFVTNIKQIDQMQEKSQRYRSKIAKKEGKMQKILNQIEILKRSSHQIAANLMNESRYKTTCSRNDNSKMFRTERTQIATQDRNSMGFKMINVGSTQFISNPELV